MTDVIFVDDDRVAADRFARLLTAETNLTTFVTNDTTEAVEKVRSGQILVAVLDQRLDGLKVSKGTALLAEMRKASPLLRAVMLSGQADASDYQDAIRVKFDAFVDKNDIGKLSEVVRGQFDEALVLLAQNRHLSSKTIGEYRHGFSLRGPAVKFKLLGLDAGSTQSTEFVLPDSWRTVAKVNAGETVAVVVRRTVEREVLVEREELAKSISGLKIRTQVLGELAQQLEISGRERTQVTTKEASELSITRTYSLELQAQTAPQIRARDFQIAALYTRRRAVVVASCECCGTPQYLRVPVLTWTGRFSTRQIDYYSDSTTAEFATGLLEGP